jgi:hypothetical protein
MIFFARKFVTASFLLGSASFPFFGEEPRSKGQNKVLSSLEVSHTVKEKITGYQMFSNVIDI